MVQPRPSYQTLGDEEGLASEITFAVRTGR
jgi:hypothetical protein